MAKRGGHLDGTHEANGKEGEQAGELVGRGCPVGRKYSEVPQGSVADDNHET